MKPIYIIYCLLLFDVAYSQNTSPSLISSSGNSYINSSAIMYYSIGEIAIETYITNNDTLTQGFHQDILKIPDQININEADLDIQIYPNPTSSKFIIELDSPKDLDINLFDVNRKLVFRDKLSKKRKEFHIENLAEGNYFLHIIFENKKLVYKIQKTN